MSAPACVGAVLLAIGGCLTLPAVAGAREEPTGPRYAVSIVEGETTHPEESILSTSGSVFIPHAKVVQARLRIVHDGLTVAEDTEEGGGSEEGVWLSQVPQVGDTVYLESPVGTVVGSVAYDGLPSMDPTVCAGSANFSGQRSANMEVKGSYFTLVPHPSYTAHRFGGEAQVPTQTGSTFGGSFLTPLALGETVRAVETLTTPLAGEATFTYTSENDRPVGACPVPPQSPPPPPPPPALAGSIVKLFGANIHKLLKSGLTDEVTINQAGTVTQDLYELGGKVPATAAAHGRHGTKHKHKPPALLLARGTASATTAGTVTVHLRITGRGRHALSRRRKVRAVLVSTLKTSSGAKLNLPTRAVTLVR